MIIISRHVFYCCGAKVLIEDDVVRVLSKPVVKFCPLMKMLYGVNEISERVVLEIVREKIEKYGLYTSHRKFDKNLIVPYGASEIISVCMRAGLLTALSWFVMELELLLRGTQTWFKRLVLGLLV